MNLKATIESIFNLRVPLTIKDLLQAEKWWNQNVSCWWRIHADTVQICAKFVLSGRFNGISALQKKKPLLSVHLSVNAVQYILLMPVLSTIF